jgi:sulfur carrier protein ThiS
MRIRLHFSGPIKAGLDLYRDGAESGELEVADGTTPRDLLRALNIPGENIIALINGKPVPLEKELTSGDRLVLMLPQAAGKTQGV